MFIPAKDKHALEKAASYFWGVGMGCFLSWSGWRIYVGVGAFAVGSLLQIAAAIAGRRAMSGLATESGVG